MTLQCCFGFCCATTWSSYESEVAQSCPTLCDPMDGILQARKLDWVAISFSRGSSRPKDQTQVSGTVGRHLTVWATWEVLSNREPAISTHISPPSKTSLPPPASHLSPHGAGYPVLNSYFPLANYFTHDRVYMSTLLSQFFSLSFILCPSVCLCMSLCPFFIRVVWFFLLLNYMHHSYMWILSTKGTNLIGLECRTVYVPEFLENDTRIAGGNLEAITSLLSSETYSQQMLLLFSHSVLSNSLWPHRLQHGRLPCHSLSPGFCLNSCPLSWWCHPTIPSSVTRFSSCLQSFPASGSFSICWLFAVGAWSIRASASASVLPMNIQSLFPLGLIGLISL